MAIEDGGLALLPQVGLKVRGAGVLADLQSLSRDVGFAAGCARRYAAWARQGVSEQRDDALVAQALWNAGVISYRRAFTSGRGHVVDKATRLKLGDVFLDLLSSEQRLVHDEVLELANQHVAHRVGVQEGAAVTVFLAPDPPPRAIVGVGALEAHMIGPLPELADGLAGVCEVFLRVLAAEVQNLSDRLIVQLAVTPGLEALYARATVAPTGSETPPGSSAS